MVIFHSYVKLPEGNDRWLIGCPMGWSEIPILFGGISHLFKTKFKQLARVLFIAFAPLVN